MKIFRRIIFIALFFIPLQLFAMTGQEAADACEHAQRGFIDSITTLKLEIIVSSGKKRIKRILYKQKEKSAMDGEASIMIFSPNRCAKSMAILTVGTEDKQVKQWMFLPALKKVRSLSSETKGGSLAGSEFSYEDLAAHSFGDYRHSPDAMPVIYQGKKALQYTRYPIDPDSYYSKHVVIIDANSFVMYKIDFYDQKEELFKTLTLENYSRIENLLRFQRATMLNHLNGNRSIFHVTRDQINIGLPPETFDRELLEKQMKQTRCIR